MTDNSSAKWPPDNVTLEYANGWNDAIKAYDRYLQDKLAKVRELLHPYAAFPYANYRKAQESLAIIDSLIGEAGK
jgi:hypothetical protein